MVQAVEDTTHPLNRTEHGYAAVDGAAGTMVQPYMIRLNAPVAEALVRRSMRSLVTHHPRLRGVVSPGLHFCRLRILPDDELVDQLFNVAYRVEAHIDAQDSAALEAYQTQMLNEVMPLERGLSVHMRFIPHASQPVVFLCLHHLFGDGRTCMQLVGDLLKLLNGQAIEMQPVETPSMIGAVAPAHWWQWPRHIWRSRQHKVNEARRQADLHIQQLPMRATTHFSVNAMRQHRVSVGSAELRQAARKLGVSLNTFMVSAVAQSFLDMAPDDPQAAAVIRISVDLRRHYPESRHFGPLWGNHVGAFLVTEDDPRKSLPERVRSVGAHVKEGLDRFARREMFWTYLLEEAMPLMGRTLLGHVVHQLKRQNKLPKISCHCTSLGDVSHINPPGATIKAIEFQPIVTSVALLMVMVELDGVFYLPTSWQRSDNTVEEIDACLARLDLTFERLVREAGGDRGLHTARCVAPQVVKELNVDIRVSLSD
ncbi:hypothetical protein [Aquabacterium sp.]|uniref:hypothetical protein n=1 Tax=Aquabacterium sp. TaxID=1872578 RepID=UPI002487967A|nr:hypothetical protein [Aquabacterium sp.]MDI1258045.1 hypothetical protein [Aquabacterium sp.]